MKTTKLEKLNACIDAVEYVKTQKSAIEAWSNCPRGDWMLWLASKLGVDKRLLTLAKGRCVETVLHLMIDQRSKDVVKAAIDYGNGLIDDGQLNASASASADASAAAYAAASADAYDAAAAYAAAYAAASAAASAYAAYAAASADASADASAYAAYAAAYAAASAAASADASAYAAYAAASADASADASAYAAYADASADAYAAAAAAKKGNRMLTANICREILTKEVLSKCKKF